ncbi:hypothetical protein DVR12_22950 [Chitinophaga silvatica]|uniref:Uncharacterized protein n=1 Tax=Chitinophaga silvatica TaxID=2282649 RepID=A0A3E1Y4D0_9BACT|nr:hypothetical protein [Chitinophaga silvatica]RFS19496.1 hypothetical protein DVR12_22950 [Chitinophaga silvatica]
MYLKPVLLLAVTSLCFSCKKDKTSDEDKLSGSYSACVQMEVNGSWTAINIDSIKSNGRINYVLNKDHSGFVTKVDIPTSPVTAPIDLSLKTRKCFWEYYPREKKLLILDSLRQLTETWNLDEINNNYLSTVPEGLKLVSSIPSAPILQRGRVLLIRK